MVRRVVRQPVQSKRVPNGFQRRRDFATVQVRRDKTLTDNGVFFRACHGYGCSCSAAKRLRLRSRSFAVLEKPVMMFELRFPEYIERSIIGSSRMLSGVYSSTMYAAKNPRRKP